MNATDDSNQNQATAPTKRRPKAARGEGEGASSGDEAARAADTGPMSLPEAPPEEVVAPVAAEQQDDSAGEVNADEPSADAAPAVEEGVSQRRRIEEQLEALKRREAELRRELVIAEHPELVEAMRELAGRVYAVSRVDAKIAQGPSKSEERRRDTLEKKLASAREKQVELLAHIAELEAELAPLGPARARVFDAERREAMEELLACMAKHEGAFVARALDTAQLVPELARYLPEVKSLAQAFSDARTSSAPAQP